MNASLSQSRHDLDHLEKFESQKQIVKVQESC